MKKLILILCVLALAGCMTTRGGIKWSAESPQEVQGNASIEWNYKYSSR
jgi:hypothetical protein